MGVINKNLRRILMGGLSLTLCVSLTASTIMLTSANGESQTGSVSQSVGFTDVTDKVDTTALREQNFNTSVLKNDQVEASRVKTVIVGLSGESILDYAGGRCSASEYLATAEGRHALRNIESEQRAFLKNLNSQGISYYLKSSYSTIYNALAIEVLSSDVAKIKQTGGVEKVVYSQTYLVPQTIEVTADNGGTSSDDISTAINVHETGIYNNSAVSDKEWGTGKGSIVAILDTGLDYTHRAFNSREVDTSAIKFNKDYVTEKLGDTEAFKRISQNGGMLTADDVYVSDKVAFAFDYADNDADVYPSYSNHGTHVAGIVAGYDPTGYTDKNGQPVETPFTGVAPDAQLMICKVFTDDLEDDAVGGAESENILSALEDCVKLGVDVINMSLGTTAGFTLTEEEKDEEGQFMFELFDSIREAGISLICAASNDYSAGYGSAYGTNLSSNPDSGTVGSPSTYNAALAVASISGQKSKYFLSSNNDAIFYDNSRDGNMVEFDFQALLFEEYADKVTDGKLQLEYVVVPGVGQSANYTAIRNLFTSGGKSLNRLALVKRGTTTFQEKVETAHEMGAAGIIIYNNVSGKVRMSLGDVEEENRIPAISITLDAGNALTAAASNRIGTITLDSSLEAGPFMSEFSSWGVTPDLILKPEITAHGGEITSTVPGGYDEQSGTSMASPNMAGLTALVRNYVKNELEITDPQDITRLSNQLIMSTATMVRDESGLAYSPRKQGAGLANLDNIVNKSTAYLFTDEETDGDRYYEGKDYRPKAELGDDKERKGEYSFAFKVKNFGENSLQFKTQSIFMTEELSSDKIAVAEKARYLSDKGLFTVTGGNYSNGIITVSAGGVATVKVTLKLTEEEKKYLNESFVNGMFVEGFVQLISQNSSQCDLILPFVGFYGDWEDAPMLDYTAYEISEIEQDTSIEDFLKDQAAVWASQPYANYSRNNYVIPMGSYVYIQDENDTDKIYADEEHNSISRFDEFVSDDGVGNYLTTYSLKCIYAGLLRNARRVDYRLYDAYTGEVITADSLYRISKAYANGGTATPAFIELQMEPEQYGLVNNGKYKMDFEFYFSDNSVLKEENVFSFNFYVDYEAPVLQDVRVRYYNYKDSSNKDRQRIYLDFDIFDNHYAQSLMLCYYDVNDEIQMMNLATEYATPIKNAVKNGTCTVSVEVTDIWDQYKDVLAVQIDDYALNHSTYILNSLNGVTGNTDNALNANVTPDTFELAEGEDNITVELNSTRKVSLVYEGSADLSNFGWSANSTYVSVKNGEIFGRRVTRTPQRVSVTNKKGVTRIINVTVVDTGKTLIANPSISFGAIENDDRSLQKASGTVKVNAGEYFNLNVLTDPWYYDTSLLDLEWTSSRPDIATVEGVKGANGTVYGKVHTIGKGRTTITATRKGTPYSTSVSLNVQDPFDIESMALRRYHGEGETIDGQSGVVIIPDGKNIMEISDEAFKDNTSITKVIIPKTVTKIGVRAFVGCTSLKEVYFISEEEVIVNGHKVADSDLTLIDREAFKNCTALEKVDFTNVKVITVAREAFMGCTSLKEVVKSTAIGTAYDRVFLGCTSLKSFDMSELHVSGNSVFSGCTSLTTIDTDKYTAIGSGMFSDLDYYYQEYVRLGNNYGYVTRMRHYDACTKLGTEGAITIKTSTVRDNAFENCTGITNVTFDGVSDIVIGSYAFAGCTNLSTFNLANGSTVKSLGLHSFDDTEVTSFGGESGAIIRNNTLIKYTGDAEAYTVPSGITAIGAYAFAGSNVTAVDLSQAQITEIGAYAFAETGITSVEIPASVVSLGDGVFADCASLTQITFEEGSALTAIPAYAFSGTGITSITLPATVRAVGSFALTATPITSFSYAPTADATFGDSVFYNCAQLEAITLADNIRIMGDYVFAGCTSLTRVTLPSLTALGAYTFAGNNNLINVTFGANSTVTGSYTFVNVNLMPDYSITLTGLAKLATVKLGGGVTEIGEAVFYGNQSLTTIDLKNAKVVGAYAFFGCSNLTSVTGIANVTDFGEYSFANCSSLNNFSIASAKNISRYAFYGAKTSNTVTIGSSVEKIGGGAFAANSALTAFAIDGNDKFFVNDGVLYKYLTESEYELIAYPSAKAMPAAANQTYSQLNGKKVYKVIDGTVAINASAFAKVNRGNIEVVLMPYTLEAIGDRAFFETDIYEYCFESINAPVLQSEYNAEVDALINYLGYNYRAYYLANFVEEILLHTSYGAGAEDIANLTVYRPENGIGYDNLSYSLYFGKSVSIGILPTDNTRKAQNLIDSFPIASVISGWNTTNKTLAEIEEFSADVQEARRIVNNTTNATQLSMITDARVQKLSATESALRKVKEAFGIQPKPLRLRYETDDTFKSVYKPGEMFSLTGLTVYVEYLDGSVDVVPHSDITVVSNIDEYTSRVTISAYGLKYNVNITVEKENSNKPGDDNPEKPGDPGDPEDPGENCSCSLGVADGIMFAVVALLIAGFAIILGKKSRHSND